MICECLPVYVFEREVRPSDRVHSGVVETRDVRMLETRQDVALAGEALLEVGSQVRQRWELQRHLAFEGAIGAPRQPYLCHATRAKRTNQLVRPHAYTGLQVWSGRAKDPAGPAELRQYRQDVGNRAL